MSEVEGGGTLAWRLLATLEGGSLVLVTSALFAYSLRKRLTRARRPRRPVRTVLLSDTSNALGKELKTRLESRGCVVSTVPSDATSDAGSGKVDALIVVGAHATCKPTTLQAIANLVNDDVYRNLETLELLSRQVKRGGCVSWASAGSASGNFQNTGDAFDIVLEANIRRVAQICHCEPIWVGRSDSVERAAERVVDALLSYDTHRNPGFSMRNAAHQVGEYIGRWLKIVT